MSKELKNLGEKYNKIDGSKNHENVFSSWIENFKKVGKPGDKDDCPDNIDGFIDILMMALNNSVNSMQHNGDQQKTKKYKDEVFKFIDDTMYPYEKCLMVERLDNYTKNLDKINIDKGLKKEMKNNLKRAKEILNKLNKINDESQEDLMEDAFGVHAAMKKARKAQKNAEEKIEKKLTDKGKDYYQDKEYRKLQKINIVVMNQYLITFYHQTIDIGLWKNGKPRMNDEDSKMIDDLGMDIK